MAKTKTAFFCQNCGHRYAKWVGQCTSCKSWNSVVEEPLAPAAAPAWSDRSTAVATKTRPQPVAEIEAADDPRVATGDPEFDRVLGGGLVRGSLTLLGGEPGIGKSTLLLQTALRLPIRTLYISGEESPSQIKLRADRLGGDNGNCLVLPETRTQALFTHLKEQRPDLVIVDSVQTLRSDLLDSAPGSVGQIRQSTSELIEYAKKSQVPVILVGHITKEGHLAGPKLLEHMVDTVLQFEGDRNHVYRIVRSLKNRFGSTSELGIYQMQGTGLKPVTDPSEVLLSPGDERLSGMAIAATLEGIRPLMVEIQALVGTAVYGTPQRSTTGYPSKRLNMLLAVLEKRAGFPLGAKDVFLNITGGIQVDDPAIDLAVIGAILSSNTDIALDRRACFAAEVGLAGELRPVQRLDDRIREADRLGFERIYIARNAPFERRGTGIEVVQLDQVGSLVGQLFG